MKPREEDLSSSKEVTPKPTSHDRREFIKGAGSLLAMGTTVGCGTRPFFQQSPLSERSGPRANLHGTVEAGLEPVRETFARLFDKGEVGAGLAVWREGRVVVDLWGGWRDAARTLPWQADTLVQTYSVCKPFAALCLLLLIDRGQLELDAPAARWWPELRAPATVRHLLSHQAGLVALREPQPTEVFHDWDRLVTLLAREEPWWTPGTRHGEHALFYGHLVGELVRRVDGRDLGTFLREEVCRPLGLEFHFGLTPEEQARTAELVGLTDSYRRRALTSRGELYRLALDNPPGMLDAEVVNGARWRAAQIPAINGHGTARAIALFYAALLEGRLLSERLRAEAVSTQCSGPDAVLGRDVRWGLGFALEADGFGMGGLGGSLGWASHLSGYTLGFVTNTLGGHDRVNSLEKVLRECLGAPPLPD